MISFQRGLPPKDALGIGNLFIRFINPILYLKSIFPEHEDVFLVQKIHINTRLGKIIVVFDERIIISMLEKNSKPRQLEILIDKILRDQIQVNPIYFVSYPEIVIEELPDFSHFVNTKYTIKLVFQIKDDYIPLFEQNIINSPAKKLHIGNSLYSFKRSEVDKWDK